MTKGKKNTDQDVYDKIMELDASNRALMAVFGFLSEGLKSVKKDVKSVDSKVQSLDDSIDTRIKLTILEKLDVKWQAFGVMVGVLVAVMSVILTIHAAAIYLLIG